MTIAEEDKPSALHKSQQPRDYFHRARRQALSPNHLFIPVTIVVS